MKSLLAASLWIATHLFVTSAFAESAKLLSLDSAMTTAATHNPELKALEQDAVSVKTQAARSRYWEDPMIGVRFYQVPFSGGFDEIGDIDYIVRQTFPLGGKAKAKKEMAFHEYQHRLHVLGAKGLEVIKDLKSTYYQLYSIGKQLAVSRELEGKMRSLVGSGQARLASNAAPATDAILGQTEVAKLLVERQSLLQRQGELQAKLRQLMADPDLESFRIEDRLESPHWEVSLEELMQLAQAHHPNLQSEKHHIEEKEWGVKAAKSEFFPNLQLQTEYVQRPGDRGDAFTGEMMLSIPLIVSKKNLGVRQAQAELASARYTGQAVKNDVEYRIRESYTRLQSAGRALALSRGTLLPQARQAYAATTQAYGAGKIAISDVLAASRMLLEAQMNYWQAFENQALAFFSLENAVGKTVAENPISQEF